MMRTITDQAREMKPDEFDNIESCLVLAPHPDDESLGCGGLIAALRKMDKAVSVLFITDGSLSHPHSRQYPAEKLAALRKEEALAALSVLGVPQSSVFFLAKKDGSLPAEGEEEFEQNANQMHLVITLLQPDLILVPYEKDPHRDHRAAWQMLMSAHEDILASFRILEYVVWLLERGEEQDMPEESAMRYIDITSFRTKKMEAIKKHLSQTTNLINDDPHGFTLSEDMLRRAVTNREYYIDRQL